jgi:hypothetical protein
MLIAAHGNSLRAIVKHLFNVPDDEIVHVEIPTGNPLVIELDAPLKPTRRAIWTKVAPKPLPHGYPAFGKLQRKRCWKHGVNFGLRMVI